MGSGIALTFASKGFHVRLVESSPESLTSALSRIGEQATRLGKRKIITSTDDVIGRIMGGRLEDLGDCELVIEAIVEDLDAKCALFAALDSIVSSDAVLASNTSYLDIGRMAAATRQPERVGGLHFFNPPQVMRLVEVVRAQHTSPTIITFLAAVAKQLGKLPIIARIGEGFIGNRIFAAYRAQSEFLLEEGCYPDDVDRAMRDFGMAMGPFQVSDLAGLDIAWAMRKRLEKTRVPHARYVGIPDIICERGWLGKKVGRGWYNYSSDPDGVPDDEVNAIIDAYSAAKGIRRRSISADEVRARLLTSMVNEAAHVLNEGVANCSADVDLVTVYGYGFPAFKGGLMYWAMHESVGSLLHEAHLMAESSGAGIQLATNLEDLLRGSTRKGNHSNGPVPQTN